MRKNAAERRKLGTLVLPGQNKCCNILKSYKRECKLIQQINLRSLLVFSKIAQNFLYIFVIKIIKIKEENVQLSRNNI